MSFGRLTTQRECCKIAGTWRLTEKDESSAGLFGSETEAIPRRQWDTYYVLWEHIAHVEDYGSKASKLEAANLLLSILAPNATTFV
jgi:hypothetical protein